MLTRAPVPASEPARSVVQARHRPRSARSFPANPSGQPGGEIDRGGIQSPFAILICAGIAIYGIDIRSFSAYIAPEPAVPRYENGLF